MKAYTLPELQTFVAEDLSPLRGARLQEIRSNDRGLALGLWKGGLFWLILDLLPQRPLALVLPGEECPFRQGPKHKPLGLFLRAKARDRLLSSVEIPAQGGRILILRFGPLETSAQTKQNPSDLCELEIHLIPKQPNLLARCEGKQIAWSKPKELPPPPALVAPISTPRSPLEVREEWLQEMGQARQPAVDPLEVWRRQRDRDLEKKRKALTELEAQMAKREDELWQRRGEDIKAGEGEWIDPKRSLAWNMDQAFQKAKQLRAKRQGQEERLQILRGEIQKLETAEGPSGSLLETPKGRRPDLLKDSEARGRKKLLADGSVCWRGKSAADNLTLLRKAKAWDYWLHLRDLPGAHAILQRNSKQNIPEAVLYEAAEWLARESLSRKELADGGKWVVILAECRHVKPIKGDRLGRVNFQNERSLLVDLTKSS